MLLGTPVYLSLQVTVNRISLLSKCTDPRKVAVSESRRRPAHELHLDNG